MGIMDTEKIYEGLGISREVWEYGHVPLWCGLS